jgi:hypothetical protein
MQESDKFNIIIYDENGKELLLSSFYSLNCSVNEFLVNEVFDKGITSPLIHKQSREWFYPAGSIQLNAAEDNKTAFIQNEIVIFEFSGSLIEFETLSSGKFICSLYFM